MRLHTRILIGLIAGAVVGGAARYIEPLAHAIEWLEPAGTIFIRLITMVVVPLVIAGLFVGVASLGDIRRLGRIGGRTLAYFLVTTTIAAVIGVTVALLAGAGTGIAPTPSAAGAAPIAPASPAIPASPGAVPALWQTISSMVPANPIAAAAQGDLLAVIFTVILFAAAATTLDAERRRPLVAFFGAANDVALVVIQWLMTLAPAAVAILIAVTVLTSGADLLRGLASYAMIVVGALVIHTGLVLVPMLRVGAGLGPGRFVAAVGDVLLLAFSTASSSVTLPVSVAAARTRLGVSTEVSSFVLPTGTTLNKNGAAVYKAVTAVFLAHLYGVDLGVGTVVTIVLTTVVAASAGAGVPGSSLVTTLIVLNAIGLGANAAAGIALVSGIDRPLDMCRTAVNTFGNLVGTAIVARAEGEQLRLVDQVMAPQTVSEKILSSRCGHAVHADDIAICTVDCVLGTDGSAPMAIDYFERMTPGGRGLFDPARVFFSLDHYAPPNTPETRAFHARIRRFAEQYGATVFDVGDGISHQVALERGLIRPGDLVIGADSHTVTCGAVNCLAIGVGSSDLAAAMFTGQIWLRVPQTVRITLTGRLGPEVAAKDLALALVGTLGADGANYCAVEFAGPGVASLSIDDRLVLSNLMVESGAKGAIFPFDAETSAFLTGRGVSRSEPVAADPGAVYVREVTWDVSIVVPQVARPHTPDHVFPLSQAAGTPVQMVFIGTCTGGRVVDFHDALRAFRRAGGHLASGVQLVLTPASREVHDAIAADGTLDAFVRAGATVTETGCGACCGTSGVIPGDGATVLSTANRNFKARMGNATAAIFLASPAACGAAAAIGLIPERP